MKPCANVSILFEEVALLERFAQTRAAGFAAQRAAAQGVGR
jgi:hydroxypyruvate isomerase